ncbi:MAG: hypothetical protein Kow0042_06770 [Calditrichia bacterium]
MKSHFNILLWVFFLVLIGGITMGYGGTKGKIAGIVIDATSKEPLIGANIVVEETTLGAASDEMGFFAVLNVPPGTYVVTASMIGYRTVQIQKVVVNSDLTTNLKFELEQTAIEGDVVVVTAERPVLQKDITGKQSIVDAELIENIPIDDVSELLTIESNVIEVPRTIEGTSVGIPYYSDLGIPQIHIRGGRVSEIQYMIDGLPVTNPIFGELAVKMNKEAIREMQILAGSFNAEYGNAMSGLVNIVTKEGSHNWSASLDYKTTELGSESDRLWNLHDVSGSLSGPLSKITGIANSSFFASFRDKKGANAVYEFDDIVYDPENPDKTYGGYGRPRLVNPLDTKKGWQNFGFDDIRDALLKLSFPLSHSLKLNLSGSASLWRYKLYNFWWIYNMENRNINEHRTLNLTVNVNHMLNPSTYYTLGISRFYKSRTQRLYRHLDGETIELVPAPIDPSQPIDSSRVYRSSEPRDPYYNEFYIGDDEFWTDEFQTTYNVKFDLTSQVSKHHLIKSGIDLRFFNLDVNEQEEIHPGGAHYLSIYKKTPIQAAGYIQDKMEFDYLIVNAGLRLDYESAEGQMWKDPTEWKSPLVEAEPYWRLAPRLGVALPFTNQTIFHYNYGIFYQHASYRNRFIYPDREYALTAIWPLLGNPRLEPEKTTAYELGVKQQINRDMYFEVNLWLKKTANMVGTVWIPQFNDETHTNPQYGVFANLDYSSAKGLDISLKKRFSHYTSFEINYTWSRATGIREDPWQGYRNRHTPAQLPKQERILDWNQPHVVRVNFFLWFPYQVKNIFLKNLRFSLFYRGNSGYPYTPSTEREVAIGPINSRQRPWQNYIDVRLVKSFSLSKFTISPYVEIDNVFDIKNVVFTYVTTGSAKDPGDYWQGTTTYRDRPHYYGPRRQIRTGIKFEF